MSNSLLTDYTLISPNKCVRTSKIDTITIHCFVGQCSVTNGCKAFQSPKRKASCNYVVAFDGKVGLVVPESYRSWCSSNQKNDDRAITIEVASDIIAPYKIKDAAMDALINLLVDICKRNDIKRLVWSDKKTERVNHKNGVNMTCHRDFANKSCPGEYIYQREGNIAAKVNDKLNNESIISGDSLGIRKTAIGSIDFSKLDYTKVYDYKYYRNKYADLCANGLKLQDDYFKHFKLRGMLEARQGNSKFNPIKYREYNLDLNDIFGDAWEWYYAHYIITGYKEGRRCL